MSRSLVSSTSRLLLHPSPTPLSTLSSTQSHHFSTSTPTLESKSLRNSRRVRKTNLEKKLQFRKAHADTQPDPILGYAKGRESIWENSLLKSVLLRREEVWGETVKVLPGEKTAATSASSAVDEASGASASSSDGGPYVPKHFNFGLKKEDAELLSNDLPLVAAHRIFAGKPPALFEQMADEEYASAIEVEEGKRDKLMRIVDLKNAGSKGIEVENTRRIVNAFGRDETDTGSPEVQAAIQTARIHSIYSHLVSQPRDVMSRRPLRDLVQKRVKTLKYLKSLDVVRYENCLERIGVEPRAVEGEIHVTKLGLRALIRPQS